MPLSKAADPAFSEFVSRLDPAVRAAAAIAHGLEGRVGNQPKADEINAAKQALTEADTAAQEAILEELRSHFPQVALAAEEDTPSVRDFAQEGAATVVIDPIDGTLHSYLEGSGPYAVIVGLALEGALEASLIALPREGLLFTAQRGKGAETARIGSDRHAARLNDTGHRILVSHNMPEPVSARLRQEGFDTIPACGGAVAVAPLIPGVRGGIRHAPGELGISIRGRVGALISAEAGAQIRCAGAGAFPLDLETPASNLVVATAARDADLLEEVLVAEGLA